MYINKQKLKLNAVQFDAIAQLLRLRRGSKSRMAAYAVVVLQCPKVSTARDLGLKLHTVSGAVTRIREGMNLAQTAVGDT